MELCCFHLGGWEACLLLVLAVCLLLYIYGKQPYGLWERLGVPGPKPSIFLGNIPDLYGSQTAKVTYANWQAKYGRTYGAYYFRKPALVTTDPELIKQVLIKDFANFRDRFSQDDDAMINNQVDTGIFFTKGETWKRIRALFSPSFSITKIKAMTNVINNSAKRLGQHVLESAKKGVPLDAKLLFGAFAMDVVTSTGFSIDVDSLKNLDEPFTKHGRSLFIYKKSIKLVSLLGCSFPMIARPVARILNSGFFKTEDMEFFNASIRRMIDDRRSEPDNVKRVDFLQLLIDVMDRNPEDAQTSGQLKKEEVVAQGIMLFIAGYETASSTLQFLCYELTRHPEIQDKLVAEIGKVIGDQEPSYDACLNLKYTDAVINETLRMYPPLSVLTRENEKATTLNGISLPPRTGIAFPLYLLGRDPEFWENPDDFNPDRFIEENDTPHIDPFAFIPFGAGPRICVGMKLGILEMKLALIHVLQRVVLTKATPDKLHIIDFTAILQPAEPIMIHATPRETASE
ncbi:unnamed protein product [Candidula unifasciata]|uniref:Cytochrome P450 n=1 Tax=Candidula unifasciata TaxID=100452 RepID=A0A8S3YFN1_9EUPU|nr:unnamed protein product [Candidula unifasciata]